MLITESKKSQAIIDVLSTHQLDVDDEDGIVYLDPGLNTHKSAKRQANDESTYDSLFEAFERTWGAVHACGSMVDPKKDVVLEMGCANMLAYNAFKILRAYPNYIGVDIRKDYLLRSNCKNRKDVLGMCADLTKPLPIKSDSIAAVILSEVVEHLTYEQNMIFLKEAFRILKPGGKMLISSPVNTEDREFHNVENETHLGHVFFWTAEKLEEEMLAVGFKSVDKKWGLSSSTKIRTDEIKKQLHPEVAKFIEDISYMYGSRVARAVALSAPNVVNGGCRFTFTK